MDTLITEINDLADIADLLGSPITGCQCIDIGYIILQQCKPLKNSLRNWNALHAANRTYTNFKNHFRKAKIALRKTRKISVDEGLNHTAVVNMITEGVRVAFLENSAEQINNADKKYDLRCQVEEIRALIEKINAAQQHQQQQPVQNTVVQQQQQKQ